MISQSLNDRQSSGAMTIVCTGDIVLDVPDPDYWLAEIAPALQTADLAIGHLEVPHTFITAEHGDDVPAPGADPAHIPALSRAGVDAVTLAGNHIADCGAQGIADTVDALQKAGIACCGAGSDLDAARQPMIVDIAGRSVAVLSYNCVGPEFSWATETSAGCAYLPVATEDGSAVTPQKQLTVPEPEAFKILERDIKTLRAEAGLVIVALHKGTVHTPAVIARYEHLLGHAAIDAGADVVISHHAHIIRGIEYYKGKPVFHGLGNGCVVTHALSPDQNHLKRAAWAERRKQLFGFEPDAAYTLAPFHPEAVNAFMATLCWHADGTLEAGILPVHIDPPGRPRVADDNEAARIRAYIQKITRDAGLPPLTLSENALVAA